MEAFYAILREEGIANIVRGGSICLACRNFYSEPKPTGLFTSAMQDAFAARASGLHAALHLTYNSSAPL